MSLKKICLAGLFTIVLPGAALADLESQVTATEIRVRLASKFENIASVNAQLQQALNCLVGPKGKGFSTAQPNPCADGGNGVIPDTKDATEKAKYEDIVVRINAMLTETDMTARRRGLRVIAAILAGEPIPDFNRQRPNAPAAAPAAAANAPATAPAAPPN